MYAKFRQKYFREADEKLIIREGSKSMRMFVPMMAALGL